MSYRELRNVVEMMRALGYPRLLSMENFRTPNFKLVAELLEWIVRRFDPNTRVSTILDTEQERVIFIKSVVLILLQKARIKLNPKKLYQADGYAVQELAVVIRILYDTMKQPLDADGGAIAWNTMRSKVNTKMQEVRMCRQLASQIPQSGATLYDLLAKEVIAAEARSKALSFSLDLADAEKAVKQATEAIQDELAQINHNLQNISSDEATLDAKIERKKREYEQQQKRLAKLQSFRPQYMDEYEKYEKKLKQLYAIYVLKFRNVAYLQQLQSEFDKAERLRNAQAEQAMRNMVERMRAEEIALRNNQLGELEAEDEAELQPRKKATKVFGNMTGAGLSDEEEDDLEHSELSDDDSERLDDDNKKIKEDSLGEGEEATEDKIDVSSGDDF
ncbi:Clusterin-associated protein 1 [Toxocara canis]|uniref:Clusterin-associated protein 1 n=2 Tax=Toxocara canis TaxID=6265 RepID=A0A0B2UWT1_TOXCA|nr:Clusterin-associated protein 1 [Toxocara canis]